MAYKELIHVHGREYFIIFSALQRPVTTIVQIAISEPRQNAYDLASGELLELRRLSGGNYEFTVTLYPGMPRFLSFHDKF
jgi:hypothetical protein